MTSAGGGGGPGFTSGDDYVAARLSIDIPEDGVQGIRELRDEVERFRVTMEAAARSEADHSRYLDQMTQASKQAAEAQANLTEQVQNYLNVQSQLTGSASGASGGGMTQPWSGVSAGMGASGAAGSGSRPASPTDISHQVSPAVGGIGGAAGATQMAASNPREYLNMQAPRGNINPTDSINISPQSVAALADRISQRETESQKQARMTGDDPPVKHPPPHTPPAVDPHTGLSGAIQGGIGLAGQVMNEVGGQGGNLTNLAMGGLGFAQRKLQDRQAKQASAAPAPSSGKSQGEAESGSSTEGDAASGLDEQTGMSGTSKALSSIPIVGGVVAGLAGIFGLAQSGGAAVQGMRDMAGVRGGAAGEGFTLNMHQRGLAMDPMITGAQSRQVYQALTSEGYSDASGEGADDVKNFATNNIKNFGMGVPESMQLLQMAAKGTKISLGELTDTLSKLREESKTGYLGQGDAQKLTMERAGQLQAQGVDRGDALASAARSTQVFNSDSTLAGTFSPVANDNTSVMERLHGGEGGGGLSLPKGLLPGATQRYLGHQSPEAQSSAKLNVYKYWANQFHNQYHDDGDKNGVGYANANWAFMAYLQRQEPEGEWDGDKAEALYNQVIEHTAADILSEGGGDTGDRQAARSSAPSASARAAGSTPSGGAGRQASSAFSSSSGSGQDRGPAEDQPAEVSQSRSSPSSSSPVVQQQIQTVPVTGSVTINLTPEAQRLLSVAGPQQAQLTPVQRSANAGQGGASVNSVGVGG